MLQATMSREPIWKPPHGAAVYADQRAEEQHRILNSKPGIMPDNVRVETRGQRVRQLKLKADSLPEGSSSRAIVLETLRRDYGIEYRASTGETRDSRAHRLAAARALKRGDQRRYEQHMLAARIHHDH